MENKTVFDYETYLRATEGLGDLAEPYEPFKTDLKPSDNVVQVREHVYKVCSPEDYLTIYYNSSIIYVHPAKHIASHIQRYLL